MIKQYNTQLENASRDEIAPILYSKLDAIKTYGVVDYVGFVLESLDDRAKRIDETIKELQEAKKSINSQADVIKIGVSEWLSNNGVDKLTGNSISSISVLNKKESHDIVVMSEEAVINAGYFKMIVDKTALKQALLNGINVDGARLETTHNEPSIRLNKKRANNDREQDLSQSA